MSINLIRIYNEEEFYKMKNMTPSEYKFYLEELLLKAKRNSDFETYNFIANNKLYEFFEYPPTLRDSDTNKVIEKYVETDGQRKKRLELKKYYKEICNPYVVEQEKLKVQEKTSYNTINLLDEKGNTVTAIAIHDVLALLNISNVTFTKVQEIEGKENLRSFIYKGKKYISEDDLLKYINNKHYESTNLGFVKMYKRVKTLKGYDDLRTSAKEELKEIISSDEYKKKWDEYFKKVPEDKRVYKLFDTVSFNGVNIFTKNPDDDYFDIYNPNIKICDNKIKEIPQLYNANYWAAFLGIELRSIHRYCEQGTLKFYRIGAKIMISTEDFSDCKSEIEESSRGIRRGKANVGRKKKIEKILTDNDLITVFRNYVEENNNLLINLLNEKANIEKKLNDTIEIEEQKKFKTILKQTEMDIEKERRALINSIISDKMTSVNDLVNEYHSLLKTLGVYKEDRRKAEKEGKSDIANQLNYLIAEKQGVLDKIKEEIINKIKDN